MSAFLERTHNMGAKVEQLLATVEQFLTQYDIIIPDENRTGEPEEARLFGIAYYTLESEFNAIVNEDQTKTDECDLYYMINSFCYTDEVLNDGTSVEDAVSRLNGVVQTSYGVCYLPEDRIMENTPVIQWLNERNLINPNARPLQEWEV